ncbi:MAG: cation:proton antiporter, partial [Anaerolineae bacterium]
MRALAEVPLRELAAFVVVALAASRIGAGLARGRLPLITGFLVAGMAVGPFGLGFITAEATISLKFLTDVALAFIAFAAGAEILVEETRAGLGHLAAVLVGQTAAILVLGGAAFALLAGRMPFLAGAPAGQVAAAALLGAIIMVARSPSTALAVVKEVRARGPFTRAVLGITVLSDALVIVVFAVGVSVADALVGSGFDAAAAARVAVELAVDVALGFAAAGALRLALARRVPAAVTSVAVLVVGYGVFAVAGRLHHAALPGLQAGVLSEPLLVCMVAGVAVA